MIFNNATLEYLDGKKFSNSISVPVPFQGTIPNRVAFLRDIAQGKRILHLGCLDHLPLIDDKIARGQWLHKELTTVATTCIGLDIDAEACDYVKKKYGFDNILLADFTKVKLDEVASQQWDYAILGELLEHIDNPVAYLAAIKKTYGDCIKKLIITVPNAWTRTTMRMAANSIEIINSDHRYWFTPYTLAKVLVQAGLATEEMHFTNRVPLTRTELLKKKLLSLMGASPSYNFTYASSLVAIARFS